MAAQSDFASKADQIAALTGGVFAANSAIAESYIYMRDIKGKDFISAEGKLPAALDIGWQPQQACSD
ncbi:hypothetical protein [Arthrobacter sp. NPDC057259]|uniref:hypothetical protein n=1 Tax=Arthrobacter sp. NPDC057259 TaxID=3346073 RepID=UPI0036375F92